MIDLAGIPVDGWSLKWAPQLGSYDFRKDFNEPALIFVMGDLVVFPNAVAEACDFMLPGDCFDISYAADGGPTFKAVCVDISLIYGRPVVRFRSATSDKCNTENVGD